MIRLQIILVCLVYVLGGCNDKPEFQNSNNINEQKTHITDSSYEDYQLYLENLRKLYWSSRLEEIIAKNPSEDRFSFPESPTYFHYIFNAVQPLSEGRKDEVRNILSNFELMIAIDMGKANCEKNNFIILESSARIRNSVVFNKMCHEAFLGYYGNPNELLLNEIEKYKMISDDVKKSIQ